MGFCLKTRQNWHFSVLLCDSPHHMGFFLATVHGQGIQKRSIESPNHERAAFFLQWTSVLLASIDSGKYG